MTMSVGHVRPAEQHLVRHRKRQRDRTDAQPRDRRRRARHQGQRDRARGDARAWQAVRRRPRRRSMSPDLVAPMAAFLAHEDCPVSGEIYAAGAGRFARIFIASTEGYVQRDAGADDRRRRRQLANDQRRDRLRTSPRPRSVVGGLHGPLVAHEYQCDGHELVRGARAPRNPHASQGDHRVRRGDDHLRGDGDTRHGLGRPAWPNAASVAATSSALLSYNCPEFLETIFAANYLGAIAMPINWRLAAPEVRYILEHSEARALVCDESLVALANDATKGIEPTLVRACVPLPAPDGWTPLADLRRRRRRRRACRGGGRRRAPADVHVGHDRAPEGRDDHPRQPGVEEPRAHRRVRLHERRPRAGVRAAVPRRRARPHDHVADRRGRDDDHPSRVRRGGRRRRARALASHHGVARAGDGQRDHGAARHRAARPVVGPGDHQRRREDADPAHRADPAHVSRRRGSPTRTASPRPSPATRSSTATAS